MTFIAYHPAFNHPLQEGHRFPMIKYELLYEQLLYEGIVDANAFFLPQPLQENYLDNVHDKQYVQRLFKLQLSQKEIRRIGFPLTQQLITRELLIAQGTVTAAEIALEFGIGYNITGGTHHAGSNWGEGFCLLNDQAIAARYLLNQYGLKHILFIDLDVHQGNGTAEIFHDENRVFTCSMHGQNNFPFHKEKSDLDIGLPDNTDGITYLSILEKTLNQLFHHETPQFVFYQAGADVLGTDKMGKLSLSPEDCRERDRMVFHFCKQHSVPVQVSMGGGYSDRIQDIVNAHCTTFKEGISALL